MGNCKHLAKEAVNAVINIEQIHLDPFLEISLEEHFPIVVGAVNF